VRLAQRTRAQPVLLKRQQPIGQADIAESMDVRMPGPQPVVELDTQLEGGLRGAHHRVFIETQKRVDMTDLRNGGLTHTHRADVR